MGCPTEPLILDGIVAGKTRFMGCPTEPLILDGIVAGKLATPEVVLDIT
jgi:hypothetical protein